MAAGRGELALVAGLAALALATFAGAPGLGHGLLIAGFLGFCAWSTLGAPSQIGIGIVLGLVIGSLPATDIENLRFVGRIFIALLKMLIAPMILFSITVGVARLGNARSVGRLGMRTLTLYVTTMVLAVGTGLVFVNVFEPGAGGELAGSEFFTSALAGNEAPKVDLDFGRFLVDTTLQVLTNPFSSLAEGRILPIVGFALLLGLAMLRLGDGARPLIDVFVAGERLVMLAIGWFLRLAPLGVFALLAHLVASIGLRELLENLGAFALVVIGATLVHALVTLPLVARLLAGVSLPALFRGLREPLMVAFSTSSSAATLPVTTRAVQDEFEVSPSVSSFVLPLGATVNMDGTALYEAIAALFIANVYGVDLALSGQLVVFVVAMLMAMGAPGIPSAGMVTMIVVLEAVGLPAEAVGVLLTIDRFLDTFRTMANVEGDAVVAISVDRMGA
jgi:Na+/H+-dicarboxylate symporter